MMRKFLSVLLCAALAATLAMGCSSGDQENKEAETGASTAENTEENKEEKGTIKIGCGAMTEYGATLIAEQMESLGYETELVMFDGNDLPAKALAAGDIDALLANHLPWIETFNANSGTDLRMIKPYFYYSPYSLYSTKYDSVEDIPDGAKISIPNDPTNMERSLVMLQDLGMITLGDKSGEFYTVADIEDNKKNIEFFEVEMTATVANIKDVDAGFSAAVAIEQSGVMEGKDWLYMDASSVNYPVSLVVNAEDENAEWAVEAMKLMKQEDVMQTFDEKVNGVFVQYEE